MLELTGKKIWLYSIPVIAMTLIAGRAYAVDYTWDVAAAAGITAGDGDWSATAKNWNPDGGTTRVAWDFTNNNNLAVFAGSTGTYAVTLTSSNTLLVSGMRFDTSGYTLSATTSGTVRLASLGVTVSSGVTATIGNGVTVTRSGNQWGLQGGGRLSVINGGVLTADSGNRSIVVTDSEIVVAGGAVTAASINLSNSDGVSTGILTVESGTVTAAGAISSPGLILASGATANLKGTVNLNGGTILTSRVLAGTGATRTATFNFNGGTLKANEDTYSATFMTGLTNAFIKDGGAKIDTNGFSVTVGQSLLHSGDLSTAGLTKQGSGTLTLTGANTYTGTTLVDTNGGALRVNTTHTNAGAYTVNSGGTLGGSGAITTVGANGVTVAAGGKLSAGSATGSADTLTLNLGASGKLDISAAVTGSNKQSMQFDLLTPSTSDKILVTNTTVASALNIGGNVLEFDDFEFTAGPAVTVGIYTLFDSNSTITGSLGTVVSGIINGGIAANLQFANGGQDLVLNVTATPEPSSLAAIGLGATGMMRRRRRRWDRICCIAV
jgi:autotransporter-associated beta strand protein